MSPGSPDSRRSTIVLVAPLNPLERRIFHPVPRCAAAPTRIKGVFDRLAALSALPHCRHPLPGQPCYRLETVLPLGDRVTAWRPCYRLETVLPLGELRAATGAAQAV